jgi:hypothetical protein
MWIRLTFKLGHLSLPVGLIGVVFMERRNTFKATELLGLFWRGTVVDGFAVLSAERIFGICSPFSFLSTQMLTKFFFF